MFHRSEGVEGGSTGNLPISARVLDNTSRGNDPLELSPCLHKNASASPSQNKAGQVEFFSEEISYQPKSENSFLMQTDKKRSRQHAMEHWRETGWERGE